MVGIASVFLCSLLIPKGAPHAVSDKITDSVPIKKFDVILLLASAVLVILSVFSVVHYLVVFPLVLGVVLLTKRDAIKDVNYTLLFTLMFFYIAVANLAAIPALDHSLSGLMKTSHSAYLVSILSSQIISDVPATLLLSPFTSQGKALLYGLNIGGFGTLIASFANLIAYNQYATAYPEEKKSYFITFSLYHLAFMLLMGVLFFFLL